MRKLFWLYPMLFAAHLCFAENYLLNGGQASQIDYKMEQEIVPAYGTKELIISYVVPKTFTSPSYNQVIQEFNVDFSLNPHTIEKDTDARGNEVMTAIWKDPREPIKLTITLKSLNSTKLEPLETDAPFPPENLPPEVKPYLTATKQVPVDNKYIARMTELLTSSAETQFDAVQQILTYIVDHLNYVLRPRSYDAIYSIESGKGNCQNYSHLAATLMRAAGIPVRIVNGITLKKPYNVKMRFGILTMRMAQGRHSWIEVYFPDLGWVPFDPQQMQLFVSNRFIRVEVGMDNEETISDGCIRWTRRRGTRGLPKFHEVIGAEFISDRVDLSAEKQPYGPRKMLFTPPVTALFTEIPFEEASVYPASILIQDLNTYTYDEPVVFGNLDFPQAIDFTEIHSPIEETEDSVMIMRKNFFVETSEYVTTQGQKYAQAFILEDPLHLQKVSLALHKFGGNGQLWIELFKDESTGRPNEYLATSDLISVENISFSPGYRWIDFDFTKEKVILSPGRYWIALGYTGSPVMNWFFTYGKPVGPADGTRYNTMFDETWSHSLTYEFNYRIIGMKGL